MSTHEKKIGYCTIIFCQSNSFAEVMHTFHLDLTLLNLKICNFIFIRLKLLILSAKIFKTEVSLPNDLSLTFSSLSLNNAMFMVFNLGVENF